MSDGLFGLTWDHPRGYDALAAAEAVAREKGLSIHWARQPLEGFESAPIRALCDAHDLVVMDHPHLGEALAQQAVQPLDDILGRDWIVALEAATVGPSLSSYRMDGQLWALPLDAATQVSVARPDLLPARPDTWEGVLDLARDTGAVPISWAGPHAILQFMSLAAAYGGAPGEDNDLVSGDAGIAALEILAELVAHAPPESASLNPIGLLEALAERDDWLMCPLVYQYVNYAAPSRPRPLRFADAPKGAVARGSILGGTGIALSHRCAVTPELVAHLKWLLSAEAQCTFIPGHNGQPSRIEAWESADVNARWGGFYSGTRATLEAATVRPRHNGYIRFQTEGAEVLRANVAERQKPRLILDRLRDLHRQHRTPGQ